MTTEWVRSIESFYIYLGAVIRQRRQMLGMTQKNLADDLGFSRAAVCNIERGIKQRVYTHQLLELAHFLNCEPSDILAEAQEFERLDSENLEQQHDDEPEVDDAAQ